MKKLLLLTACVSFSGCSFVASHDGEMHAAHSHTHATDCGHATLAHADHMDYLHDGHMHHAHMDHVDEHVIAVSAEFPAEENAAKASDHAEHMHTDAEAQHAMIPHGDHTDFLHEGHLHHVHGDHIDEHGVVSG